MFSRLFSLLCLTLALMPQVSAQSSPPQSTAPLQRRQVIAVVSGGQVRFSCLGEMIQMRLEVIGEAGEVLFDSGYKAGNVVDWMASNQQGERLADGSYLCVVTAKRADGEITKGQAIAVLRDQVVGLKPANKLLLSVAQAEAREVNDEENGLIIVDPGASAASAVLAHDGNSANLVSGSGG